jgi:hypothetical protein
MSVSLSRCHLRAHDRLCCLTAAAPQTAEEAGGPREENVPSVPCYEPGKRSGAWLTYKMNKAQAFVIGGYTPDNPLDALIVGYYEGIS